MGFTHLHVHTEYSLLDGAARIKDVVAKARELGMTSLAITDHGVMFGVIDFYRECIKNGIKPIIGCEVYTAARTMDDKDAEKDKHQGHLVLLAKDNTGYHNLIKIVSESYTRGFYYKPRVDKELLRRYSPAKAILFSGLIFGIFHLNPVQIIGACLIGFLLAWLYYKTRSLMACILIHIMNNGLSVYLSLKHPEMEDVTHLLSNPYVLVWAVVFILLLLLSLKQLNKYNISDTNTTTEL